MPLTPPFPLLSLVAPGLLVVGVWVGVAGGVGGRASKGSIR